MASPLNQRRPTQSQSAIPTVVFFLLISNGLLFALQQLKPEIFSYFFSLWVYNPAVTTPYDVFVSRFNFQGGFPTLAAPFQLWQVVSYGFLHADFMHLAFNMWALWMFGSAVERLLGTQRFVIYYLACVVGAAAVQLLVAHLQGGIYPTVGASGGVFGLLLAFGMAYPNRMIMLMFPPIPMKAKYFVIGIGLLELYLGLSGSAPGVANFAHLGGMLFGFLLLRYWTVTRRR